MTSSVTLTWNAAGPSPEVGTYIRLGVYRKDLFQVTGALSASEFTLRFVPWHERWRLAIRRAWRSLRRAMSGGGFNLFVTGWCGAAALWSLRDGWRLPLVLFLFAIANGATACWRATDTSTPEHS